MNPNIDKAEHVLNIDDADNRPNIDTLLETADLYELPMSKAEAIIVNVLTAVKTWKDIAKGMEIANADIELMEPAFVLANHERYSESALAKLLK